MKKNACCALLTLILTASMFLSACQTVSPWQRGHLAHPCMQIGVDRIEGTYRTHRQTVREGSAGGFLAGGGGCGCN